MKAKKFLCLGKEKKKLQNSRKGLNPKKGNNPVGATVTWLFLSMAWSQMVTLYVRKHQGWQASQPGHPFLSLSLASPPGFNEGWPGSKLCPGRNGRDIGNTGASISRRGAKLASLPGSKLLSARPSFALEEAFAKSRPANNISRIHAERSRIYDFYRIEWKFLFAHSHAIYPSL